MIQTFDIKNQRVLNLLEDYSDFIMNCNKDKWSKFEDHVAQNKEHDYFISDEHRDLIISQGSDHLGTPEGAFSYPLKPDHHSGDLEYNQEFNKHADALRVELAINRDALSQLYPPKGYIGWHNNANARGWNLIFTWSEKGDGWFRYINKEGEEITIPDKKGWQLKAGYFADYGEDVPVCYHAASTNCWRITQSFIVTKENKPFWEDCIDYITHE